MSNNNYDFKYNSFPICTETLESYINDAIRFKQKYQNERNQYSHALSMIESIIGCILSDDFDFNPDNKKIFKLLYKMLRDCGHENGKYSDNARRALQKLCKFCGVSEKPIELVDKKPLGYFDKIKSKIGGWFGSNTKKDSNEDIIDEMFANKKQIENNIEPENNKPVVAPTTVQADNSDAKATEPVSEYPKQTNDISDEKIAETNNSKVKTSRFYRFSKIAATITGGIIVTSMLFSGVGNKKNNAANINKDSIKALNVAAPLSTAHYNSVTTYNFADSIMKAKKWISTQKTDSIAQNKYKPATDSLSVKLTAASRSALNILMGSKKAQKLCGDVRAKFDAGIFKLPEGMSIERVAHAMQMSRIYEGNSIILDALDSNVKLTNAQQEAFNKHIADIGDLGVKLQKSMTAKHKLSKHSHYGHAKKSLRVAHAKNLKQLKQAKKYLHQHQR